MIVIVLVLVVGMLFGAVLADRFFQAGATTASRRALEQLECTLDGLESAYAMKAALLEARRGLAGTVWLPADRVDLDDMVVHLPQRPH
jgi:hypothetical protein